MSVFKVPKPCINRAMPPDKCVLENYFSYFSTKTYVVCTQKACLN